MDIQIARLREVMDLLKPAVAKKSKIESLNHILLKEGQAVATNLETMVIHSVPEADFTSLIPFNDVAKVLQFTPGREMLHMVVKKGKLSLSWEGGKATFPVENHENFPEVPEFVPEHEESLDTDTLIPALVSVVPYTANDTSRPILNGVTLILGDPIEVAAGDGFRMADRVLPLSFPKDITTVVPSSSVDCLAHLWKKTPRTTPASDELVPVILAKKHAMVGHDGKEGLRFQFGKNTTAIIKLVSGTPPDWLKLLPKGDPILKVQVLGPDLELALRRTMGASREKDAMTRIAFKDDSATVSAKNDGQEVSTSFKTYSSEGAPNKIAVNSSYLLQYLNGKEGIITIAWTGGTSPIALHSNKDDPRVLIMPMKDK